MRTVAHVITADDLCLSAVNFSSLYDCHRMAASEDRPISWWINHVIDTVIPTYRTETKIPTAVLSDNDLLSCAEYLRDYYVNELKES